MRLRFVVVLAALAFGARGVGADGDADRPTPPADEANRQTSAVPPPVLTRRASAPISPVRRAEMAQLGTQLRCELEEIRTECLETMRTLDQRTNHECARKLRIIRACFDQQQCHVMALTATIDGLVRAGECTRTDIERLAERVKGVETFCLDTAAYRELEEIVSFLGEDFDALLGEDPVCPLQGGEVRGVRPGRAPPSTRASHGSRLLVRWRRTGIFLQRPAPGGGGRRPRGRRSALFSTRAPSSRAWPTPFASPTCAWAHAPHLARIPRLTSACAVASHRDLPPPTRSRGWGASTSRPAKCAFCYPRAALARVAHTLF